MCKHEKEKITAEFMGAGFIHMCSCGQQVYPVKDDDGKIIFIAI